MFEPSYELEVQLLFGALMPHIGGFLNELGLGSELYVDVSSGGFPDCVLQVNGERVRVEFELYSSNFVDHGHDPEKCDMIVCWIHDWYSCPESIKVLELHKVVPELAKNGIKIIINDHPKYENREGRRWSIEEFIECSKQNLPEKDYLQVKSFIQELKDTRGIQIMTGKGKKIPTLGIGFGKLSAMEYPLVMQANGKAWIAYKNVNVKPPEPMIEEEKAKKIMRLTGGKSDKWHNIEASSTGELIDKLRQVVRVMLDISEQNTKK
jgi:hypothetical protein